MDKKYYQQYYRYEREHWWFRARARILKDVLKRLPAERRPLRILNIGAATGYSTQWLGQFGDVTSVEYDSDCCKFLNEKLEIDAINASITDLPFEEEGFDLVCAFDVIEHVDDDRLAVREMLRVCNPRGWIFVTVPAYMGLWSKHDETNHHKRRYTMKQLVGLFRDLPGSICRRSYFNTFLFPPVWIARKIMNLLPSGSAASQRSSDFDLKGYRLLDTLLYFIFSSERVFLRMIRFHFGVSILLLFNKSIENSQHEETT